MKHPAIGDWLIPEDHAAPYPLGLPGIVVAILPSGEKCVLARRLPSGRVVETVHISSALRGLMRGRVIQMKETK